jgi:hypothetical protein
MNINYNIKVAGMKIMAILGICLLTGSYLFSQEKTDMTTSTGKMHIPKYALFYDNHTMMACPDVGANFDVEAFTNRLKRCGVDYLTFHAKCNQGMAYYDTKIGIKHPSLKYDLFGKLAESCQRKGIALGAYLNAGLSHAEGVLHPEWITISSDGRVYSEERFTPFVRKMCLNTPYRDHLIAMVKEVAQNYPISGLFIDGMSGFECVCPICIEEMKEQGIDWKNEAEVMKFAKFSAIRLAKDITEAAKSIKPNLLLYFNGLGYEDQAAFNTYNDVECLPTEDFGYEFLPVMSHYVRTLGSKPVLNMNGRFYAWGDFGGLRPEAAIKSELLYGLANGLRPNIGGHFHPRGDLETAVLDRIEKIYKELQTMDDWYDNAKNVAEIAIVSQIPGNLYTPKIRSAVRVMEELKQQFDVVTELSDWSKYQVLVIPDDIVFTEETTRRVREHIAAGKAIIATGSSGLDKEKTHFVLEKEWGVKYIGENDFDPAYFTAGKNFNRGLPDMPLSLYCSGIDIEAVPGTRIEAYLIKPYYNSGWDGEYAFYYNPPDKVTQKPALTINGNVAHFSHRIFTGYNRQAPVELRTVFSNVLNSFLPEPLLKCENLPSFSRAIVTQQPGRRMVHIFSFVPEMRGSKTQMIEEGIVLYDISIALRNDGNPPTKVYLAPERKSLPFKIIDGYINVTIPVSKGYSLLVFE